MTDIQVLSVGHSLNVDFARTGIVHSVFARAVNLGHVRGDVDDACG